MAIGIIAIALCAVVFLWPNGAATSGALLDATADFECQVEKITDGDTLRCADGTRIRLHAVAARESDETCRPGHPCPSASAASATAKLSDLAYGQTLRCERVGSSYNRVTAICRNEDNIEINCAMVQSGTAIIWPRYNE
ncbi:MAG: hypothetical protein ABIV36_15945, partial [Sphingobium limneticum]